MKLRKRIFFVLVSVLVIFGIAACSNTADTVKIAFGQDEYVVKEGEMVTLDINITAGSNYNANTIRNELKFSSSDESVAKFVDGKLTGVGIGETEIKVEWSQKAIVFDKAKVTVFIGELPEVVFTEYSPNMLKGAQQTIGWKFNTSYTDATVRWESANPEVATVDEFGVVTAVGVGEVSIICYSTDGNREKAHVLKLSVSESDFAINYVLNGGTNSSENPAGYNTLHTPLTLANPEKLGYKFLGWYADEALTKEAGTIAEGTTGDVTVYAGWEVETYSIEYELDGGVNAESNVNAYTVLDEVTLVEATKDNHLFLGWFDAEGNKVVKIEKGSTGNIVLTARWELLAYNISYELNGGAFPSPYIYQSHQEMVADFVTDFNAHSGKTIKADGSNFFGSTWNAAGTSLGYTFLTSEKYGAKWNWVLKLINDARVARGANELSAADGQAEARGEIHTFLNLCDTSTTSKFGTDRSNLTYEEYAPKYMPVDPSVEAPAYQYIKGQGTKLVSPVKDDYNFAGWGVKEEVTLATNANSNYWSVYKTSIFLFKANAATNPQFSFRVEISQEENGNYYVSKIIKSGDGNYKVSATARFLVVISDSYTDLESTAAFKEAVKEGQSVVFDGDPISGTTTISLYNMVEEISSEAVGDINLEAVWAQYNDENELKYELNGGTLSDNAPKLYLTSTGLDLTGITATKEHYKFLGWSLTKGGAIVSSIEKGTRDEVTLYANYEAVEYKIEYELNGGTFAVDSIEYIYSSFDALTEDFLNDYATKFALSNLSVSNFYTKSSSYGLVNFFKDETLSTKWEWLRTYILNAGENYSGINYMKNPNNASNYNKYWRANLAAFLQKTKLTSPVTIDFTSVDTASWWETNVPTKVVTVAAEPKYSYTVEDLPLALETPLREGVEFLGWSLDETYVNVFTELPTSTSGDIKVYAKWTDTKPSYPTHKLEYELNGGELPEDAATEYQEVVGLATLPVPTRTGYIFLGWVLVDGTTDYVTSISGENTTDIKLFAQWEEDKSGRPSNYLYVGVGEDYATLKDALKDAKDGYVIVVAAGEYTLSSLTISTAVTIKGPNAGVHGSSEREAEAVIKPTSVVINSSVTFDGVKLEGSAYNQSSIPFYGGANLTEFVIKNSVVTTMKTIFESKEVHTATDAVITYQNNAFEKIGQFFMWFKADTTSNGYKAVNFINNTTCASEEFGAVGSGSKGNGMFSLRNTSSADFEFNVIGNYFVALANSGFSYFRLNSGKGTVKYNTFNNVAIYQSGSSTATMTYDENLYLDSTGAVLTSAPSVVADDHGVADTKVLATETERASLFEEWLKNNNVEVEYQINYVLNGGEFVTITKETVVSGEPLSSINTTSNGNYWDESLYPTNMFLHKSGEANAMGSKPTFAYGITLKANEEGLLVVTAVAKSGESLKYTGADYMITAAESSTVYASIRDANVTVGQVAVIDGDISTGVATVKFYDAANVKVVENKTAVEYPTTYTDSQLPKALVNPVLSGKDFYGWYFEEDFSGKRFFELPEGLKGNVTIYARFVEPGWVEPTFGKVSFELNGGSVDSELPTQYQIGKELVLPTPTKLGYRFLGWTTVEGGTDYLTILPATLKGEDVSLYAQWEYDAIYVGEDGDYQTIKEAVEAANEGAVIIVAAGTYAEDVEITKNGIVLQGANHGVAWNGTRSEETVVTSVTIKANNVVIDGIKFSAIEPIKVSGNNNVLTNLIMGATPTADGQSVILIAGDVDGLSILNSSIVEVSSRTHYRAIYADSAKVNNILIDGNKFEEDCSDSVYIDGIRLNNVEGNVTISNNTFSWPGNNFTIFVGSGSVAANSVINIVKNTFTSTNTASGVAVRSVPASAIVNVIGNSFSNVGGNVVQVRGSLGLNDTTTKVNANISNNAFLDTSTKFSIQMGLDNLVINNNYFFQDVVWSAVTATTTNDAVDAATALGGVVSHKVTFVVNNGMFYNAVPTQFVEGVELSLATVVPTTFEGFRFVGWYDNAGLTGEKVTSLGSQKADVTLYAKYEAIPTFKVTYVLGGDDVTVDALPTTVYEGTKVILPTPERFGFTFLGWTTVEGGTDYITEITVDADVTLYANWTDAEVFEVTYVFNGGNLKYQDLAAVKADFNTDYVALTGQSDYSKWKCMDALGNVFRDTNHKWDWLLNYWAGVNTNSYSGKTNASQFIKMRDEGQCDDYYFFGVEITSWYQSTQLSVYSGSMKSADYSNYDVQDAWWSYYSEVAENTLKFVGTHTLPTTIYNSLSRKFVGWYDNAEFTGEPLTSISSSMTVYAKWEEATPVSSVTIDNKVTTLKKFETLQLEWTINPSDAPIKTVKFTSSNPSVVTVSEQGFLTALSNGTATITIKSNSSTGASDSFEVTVYTPGHFDAEYESESYVELDESINLNATYYNQDTTEAELVWSSLNQDVATVDANGKVTAVNKGTATIRVALKNDETTYFDFLVTVIDEDMSEALKEVVAAHESNAFVRYDLGIGAGAPVYYADIFGSVSKLLYNHEYFVDEKYLEDDTTKSNFNKNELADNGIEFITVHYTGNMSSGADTDNNASYFASASNVSIHYVTGNKGKYSDGTPSSEIYKVLDHAHGAWHAGDSLAKSEVGDFEWNATGVPYDGCNLLNVKFTASNDFYFEINGKKTTVKLPSTYDYNGRKTNHAFNADGTISSIDGFGGTKFSNRTPESFFNDQGFPVKVENGEYYLGTTWWCYSNVYEGRICGSGGNRNSIGIESCVDLGSDLWYTWQVTAQLVAHLMIECNLDISRVKGHHFFAGKDCPQPLLENNQEIWYKFIEMVQHEYELLTTYKDTTFTFKTEGDYSFVSENGRITTQPEWTTMVSYTVTVNTNGNEEKITLGTVVEGLYNK